MKNKVRTLREAMNLTQAELGKLAGVSRQAINAIETGKFDPSIRLAFSLSKIFSKTIEEVFDFEDD
ncbi:MAG: helix-turn-helix transcriptional regulator [Dysgonamonadaceae bacterium]|nr:helix-turn-helix transcriptional regulator [Dysgonamonadaceae bacterium]